MKRFFTFVLALMLCLSISAAEEPAPQELVLGNITIALPENSKILIESENNGLYEMAGNLGDALQTFALQHASLDAEVVERVRTERGEKEMMRQLAGEQLALLDVFRFETAFPAVKDGVLCVTSSLDFQFQGAIQSGLSLALFLDGTELTVLVTMDINGTAEVSAQLLEQMIAPMMAAE